jgi:hypothetical protein
MAIGGDCPGLHSPPSRFALRGAPCIACPQDALCKVAETDESIVRASARSPGASRRYPRSSPGAAAVGCTHVDFPPRAVEPFLQSSARQCMYLPRMLWSNPRNISPVTQALLALGQVAQSGALRPCRSIPVGGPTNLVRAMSSSRRASAGPATSTIRRPVGIRRAASRAA